MAPRNFCCNCRNWCPIINDCIWMIWLKLWSKCAPFALDEQDQRVIDSGTVAKNCDEYVSLCVCLSVCSHNSKTSLPNFTNFLRTLPVAVTRPSSCGVAICYVSQLVDCLVQLPAFSYLSLMDQTLGQRHTGISESSSILICLDPGNS